MKTRVQKEKKKSSSTLFDQIAIFFALKHSYMHARAPYKEYNMKRGAKKNKIKNKEKEL